MTSINEYMNIRMFMNALFGVQFEEANAQLSVTNHAISILFNPF